MDIPLRDIEALVDYLYEDEARNYEEETTTETNLSVEALEKLALTGESSDHIYVSVVKVRNWIRGLDS